MVLLLFFSFISGILTIFAPCIWPLLPVIFSYASTGSRAKSIGITLGVMSSFAVFTLSISYLVKIFNFDPDVFRLFAVLFIGFLGLTMIIPALSGVIEGLLGKISGRFANKSSMKQQGFLAGFVGGFSLGVVWSPCAGPILATIATLAVRTSVNLHVVLLMLSYVAGVGLPLFFFSLFASSFFAKAGLAKYTGLTRRIFGVVMIFTALAIYTNYDKILQVKLLDLFPSISSFLYKFENSDKIRKQLNLLKNKKEEMKKEMPKINRQGPLPNLGDAPEFSGISKWLNLKGEKTNLRLAELKGKVVLVDFWTYTCINCIRTLPHVTGWYKKYKDKGFIVVGVHTPEFEFEKKAENVLTAIKQYNIDYPVAQDNNYATWDAYDNHAWPAKYLIDVEGKIRMVHFGEGQYEETETAIKELLKEKGEVVDQNLIKISDETPLFPLTQETYLGFKRMERFESKENIETKIQTFSFPESLPLHTLAYKGVWDVEEEFSAAKPGSSLKLHFYADKVFLVITPAGKNDIVKVYLDGKPVDQANAGQDVKNGSLKVDSSRLFNLIDLQGKIGDHILHLEFETGGTKIFAFTFG